MKIAVTGNGGAGKSTLAAALAHLARSEGHTVLAVDADPDANLAFALGIPEAERGKIVPISRQKELIEERTGAKLKQFGQIFRLNPEISDVADRFSYPFRGIHLLVLGAIEAGGSGCACPENVFLRNLLSHIVLQRDEFVIVDLEAGIEHLGRGTAQGVDMMIAVVEPTTQSLGTAKSILQLAGQVGIRNVRFVGNKVQSEAERSFLQACLEPSKTLGLIPYSERIREADLSGTAVVDELDEPVRRAFREVYDAVRSNG